jgi:hypothetical protein
MRGGSTSASSTHVTGPEPTAKNATYSSTRKTITNPDTPAGTAPKTDCIAAEGSIKDQQNQQQQQQQPMQHFAAHNERRERLIRCSSAGPMAHGTLLYTVALVLRWLSA